VIYGREIHTATLNPEMIRIIPKIEMETLIVLFQKLIGVVSEDGVWRISSCDKSIDLLEIKCSGNLFFTKTTIGMRIMETIIQTVIAPVIMRVGLMAIVLKTALIAGR
jgi:hypothetical protein